MAQGVGSGKIDAPQPNAKPVAQDDKGQATSKSKSGGKQKQVNGSPDIAAKGTGNLKERGATVRGNNLKAELRAEKKSRKKRITKSEVLLDEPPALKNCEWSATGTGWNLLHHRVGKKRYSGYLHRESWEVMKEYDYQTYLKLVEEQLRRHGGR